MKVVTSRLAGSASGVAVTATADAPGSSANGIVLMAWGAHAQKMIAGLDTVSGRSEQTGAISVAPRKHSGTRNARCL